MGVGLFTFIIFGICLARGKIKCLRQIVNNDKNHLTMSQSIAFCIFILDIIGRYIMKNNSSISMSISLVFLSVIFILLPMFFIYICLTVKRFIVTRNIRYISYLIFVSILCLILSFKHGFVIYLIPIVIFVDKIMRKFK